MGCVGDEVTTHLLLPLEPGGHLVERVGQGGELLRAIARDPGAIVAGRDAPGGRTDLGQRFGKHPGHQDRQPDAGERRDDHRRDDDGADRLVVHPLGVVGRDAGLGHEGLEALGPHDGHPDRQDRQPDRRRDERSQGDPGRDAATDHPGSVREGGSSPIPGAARYPTPRTVAT